MRERRYLDCYQKMKQEGVRTASRLLQYEQKNWVSMVSIQNLKIRHIKRDGGKKLTLHNKQENEMHTVYCWNLMGHRDGKKNFGVINGYA